MRAPGAGEGQSLPWRSGAPVAGPFPADLFLRPVAEVARALLGGRVVSTVEGCRSAGVIVETEAYGGPEDPASHASTRSGRTRRNDSMFGPPGHAYVYRSHGVHWCLNVVTGPEGIPQAVLIRGVEPLEGLDVMERRRGGRRPITAGPGRLCQALGIHGAHDGHDLSGGEVRLEPGWAVPAAVVRVTGRVGIRTATDWPLRFYVSGSPGVSRPSHPMENG